MDHDLLTIIDTGFPLAEMLLEQLAAIDAAAEREIDALYFDEGTPVG